MNAAFPLIRPVLFAFPPETAHTLTLKALKLGLGPKIEQKPDPILSSTLWGINFPRPTGLAAGFDKNAEIIKPCFDMGFGFVEVGTVTPKPQKGNPKPRIFRDTKTQSVINRMGFPNDGVETFKTNVNAYLKDQKRDGDILGINIGLNKDQTEPAEDYKTLIQELGNIADYLTINISSPNTPGLRNLQKRAFLMQLLEQIREELDKSCTAGKTKPPVLIKLAPDLDEEQREELAQTALDAKIDGLILTNTTLARPDYLGEYYRKEQGGLSGKPLARKSTQIIHNFYALTKGKIPIIGLGGISSGEDAYKKIRAGASLVQIYTGLIYQGPELIDEASVNLYQ